MFKDYPQQYEYLQSLMNSFEYFVAIRFISNHITCFHNILKVLSSKQLRNLQHYYKF